MVRGRTWTAKPTRIRLVREAMELAMTSGEANTDRSGEKWCSASQTESIPKCSARMI